VVSSGAKKGFTSMTEWLIIIENTLKTMNKKSKYGKTLQRVAVGGKAIWTPALNGLVSAA
jgi:hypothetical protein